MLNPNQGMKHRLRRVIALLRLETYSDDKVNRPRLGTSNKGIQRLSCKMPAHKNRQTSDYGACLYNCMKL